MQGQFGDIFYRNVAGEQMTHAEWLIERRKGIGGSDASAILGLNPYKTNVQLWEEKTGRRSEDESISNLACVKYGTAAEQHLRALFELDYPQYKVDYDEYRQYRNLIYPFIAGTLDGVLTDKTTATQGVLEIKTTEILSSMQREKWRDNHIPDNYYIQCLHYLLATGFDFVILKAQLKYQYGGNVRISVKHYQIEREEVKDDLDMLLKEEIEFWTEYVEKDKRPPIKLLPI